MKLPLKISPCPIEESIAEIRYLTNVPPDAIFGLIYPILKNDFPKLQKLPILQIPEDIRAKDKELKFKPHYRFSNDEYKFSIGPNVVAISTTPDYPGWKNYSQLIFNYLNQIRKLDFISTVNRFGLRYINFFDDDIYNNINLEILMSGETFNSKFKILRTEIVEEEFINVLQIANNINMKQDESQKHGSVLDIDTIIEGEISTFFQSMKDIINKAHNIEKALFFSLLKEDYISKLNPTYH
jgi:uncharacterized protein (TIGR04255 family)